MTVFLIIISNNGTTNKIIIVANKVYFKAKRLLFNISLLILPSNPQNKYVKNEAIKFKRKTKIP